MGDGFACQYPVTGFFQQILVIAVQTHVTVAVIDDDQQTKVTKPVGKNYLAVMYGMDFITGLAGNLDPLPAQFGPFSAQTAEPANSYESTFPGHPPQYL